MKSSAAVDVSKDTATIRAKHRDEEGRIKVEKVEVAASKGETLKYIEKKLVDTGVQRLERHSADYRVSVKKPAPKNGHGGKFTWEGPYFEADSELDPRVVLDKGDPNYVDEEEEEVDKEVAERVVGVVETAKEVEGREGVSRVEVDPKLGV